jgi:molecular chaperone GrpE
MNSQSDQPRNPAADGEYQAEGAGNGAPQPGFTFADKRKISSTGQPRPAASASASAPADQADAADPLGEDAGTALDDEFQLLAAERLNDLQRLQAEYANYRKRVDRDRDVSRQGGIAAVVESLLPVLDDIQLARQHGDLESGPFVSIAEKLEGSLTRFGVERFGEPGTPFDPAVHDALMHVDDELAEGTDVTTVVGVLQPGYRLGERVLRPARVSVADPK